MEIGVFDGVHGRQMIETAAIHHRPDAIEYFGFDLFEHLTDELLVKEMSKRPPSRAEVERELRRTGARIELVQGDTRETIPRFGKDGSKVDFVFIDGGHSEGTIRSDWEGIQPLLLPRSVVLFDDYYPTPHEQLEGLGCQGLLRELEGSGWTVELFPQIDEFPKDWGILRVQMACVRSHRGSRI